MSLSTAELNAAWAGLVMEELVRNGIDTVCVSSGSRCTPLVLAAARHPGIQRIQHVDERGIGYAAVGYARATGRPAAVITTSGTAVANLLPSVCEADEDRVPMIILSADRPPELRDTRANQTLDQPGIFGQHVRWQVDLPCPSADIDPGFVLTTVDQAVARSRGLPPGPVHLNLMFREPLAGDPGSTPVALGPAHWQTRSVPYTHWQEAAPSMGDWASLNCALENVHRGVLVIGALANDDERAAAIELAEQIGWPVCADVQSGLRLGAGLNAALHCPYYESLLLDPSWSERIDGVVHLGGRLVSKRLAQALAARTQGPWIQIAPDPGRHDPHHRVSHRWVTTVRSAVGKLEPGPSDPTWCGTWQKRNSQVEDMFRREVDGADVLSEIAVARWLARAVPTNQGLCIANSMPIRDVTAFAGARPDGLRICANRGVSGIDGTVATAAGFAAGLDAGVTLLTGDLSLLHDLNALALAKAQGRPLILVVINNNGGGIFHFLPVAEHQDVFEPWFGTPHGVSFESAAAMYGLAYDRPATMNSLNEAYRSAVESGEPTLLEVMTDRTENVEHHRRLQGLVRGLWSGA